MGYKASESMHPLRFYFPVSYIDWSWNPGVPFAKFSTATLREVIPSWPGSLKWPANYMDVSILINIPDMFLVVSLQGGLLVWPT